MKPCKQEQRARDPERSREPRVHAAEQTVGDEPEEDQRERARARRAWNAAMTFMPVSSVAPATSGTHE